MFRDFAEQLVANLIKVGFAASVKYTGSTYVDVDVAGCEFTVHRGPRGGVNSCRFAGDLYRRQGDWGLMQALGVVIDRLPRALDRKSEEERRQEYMKAAKKIRKEYPDRPRMAVDSNGEGITLTVTLTDLTAVLALMDYIEEGGFVKE